MFRERALAGTSVRYRRFAAPGCAAVDGIVEGYEGGGIEPGPDDVVLERTLVGVAVPDGWFDDAILLPDGALAVERGARIHVSSDPLVAGPEASPHRWRDCAVRVRVMLAGYEELRFERRAGDGPPVLRVMTPEGAG